MEAQALRSWLKKEKEKECEQMSDVPVCKLCNDTVMEYVGTVERKHVVDIGYRCPNCGAVAEVTSYF